MKTKVIFPTLIDYRSPNTYHREVALKGLDLRLKGPEEIIDIHTIDYRGHSSLHSRIRIPVDAIDDLILQLSELKKTYDEGKWTPPAQRHRDSELAFIEIAKVPIQQQKQLLNWLYGQTCPLIEGKGDCCYYSDYMHFFKYWIEGKIAPVYD